MSRDYQELYLKYKSKYINLKEKTTKNKFILDVNMYRTLLIEKNPADADNFIFKIYDLDEEEMINTKYNDILLHHPFVISSESKERYKLCIEWIEKNLENISKISFWTELYLLLPYQFFDPKNNLHGFREGGEKKYISNIINEKNDIFVRLVENTLEHYSEKLDRTSEDNWVNNKIDFSRTKDYYYGEKISVSNDTHIHYIGDIHGSLHSLIKILYKMHKNGILDSEMNVSDGNMIVFTGDLVDYSFMGIEILCLAFILLLKNKEKVIILDGNHEDAETYYRYNFKKELDNEIKDLLLRNKIEKILRYLPTVLFVDMEGELFQFNHGSFDNNYNRNNLDRLLSVFLSSETRNLINLDTKVIYGNEIGYGYKWGDFSIIDKLSSGGRPIVNLRDTKNYLTKFNINCIFSGHQDSLPMSVLTEKNGASQTFGTIEQPLYHNIQYDLYSLGSSKIINGKSIIYPTEKSYNFKFNVSNKTINSTRGILLENKNRIYSTILSSASLSSGKFIPYSSYGTLKFNA